MNLRAFIKAMMESYSELGSKIHSLMRDSGMTDENGTPTEGLRRYINSIKGSGVIRSYSEAKMYGFIIPDDGGGDVMLHKNSVSEEVLARLTQGLRVEYEAEQGPRGLRAKNITIVEV